MKKTGWIIGIVFSSIVVVFLLLLIIVGISDNSNAKTDDDNLSDVEAMALTRRASELFCAGVYYTDKAFSIDPQTTSYDEWSGYVDKADKYWDALDEVLETMEDEIDDETFELMLKKQDVRKSNPFVTTAYALDSAEIIRVFDGAPAGKRLRTLAKHLGKDMKYAQQALKMANGQITSEAWNDFANTAQKLEAGARVVKTATTAAAFVAGGPALSATLSGAATVVGGASLVMQITDDSCFVMMGDKYDSSEFVANLQKASDYVAPVAFTAGILTMDFSKAENAVLAGYDIAENFRGLFQEGKIAGIQFGLKNGKMTSMTLDELKQYQKAKADGQKLPDEIATLLEILDDEQLEQQLATFTLKASKNTVMVEEHVTFTVQDTKPEYTYIYEYGGNKNHQNSNVFEYMYQVPGTFTMNVTVLDENGEEIGRGSCSIEVTDIPTPTPNVTPESTLEPTSEPTQQLTDIRKFVGHWYASGTAFSLGDTKNANNLTVANSGGYLSIYDDETYQLIERAYNSSGKIENGNTYKGKIIQNDKGNYLMEKALGGNENYPMFLSNGYLYLEPTDTDVDISVYIVFSKTLTINGIFGGTNNGTTSKITFNGDGTGNYKLTGNMTTDQDFTYTIVPFKRFEQTGVAYKVNLVLEGGMQPSFDVYPENIVNNEVTMLGRDLPRK